MKKHLLAIPYPLAGNGHTAPTRWGWAAFLASLFAICFALTAFVGPWVDWPLLTIAPGIAVPILALIWAAGTGTGIAAIVAGDRSWHLTAAIAMAVVTLAFLAMLPILTPDFIRFDLFR